MEPLVAVYDACVLYSAFLRDLLIRVAIRGRNEGILRAKWTGRIHREWIRAVLRDNPHINRIALLRTRQLMDEHVPGCRVRGYERWEQRLTLPDAGDRHVLAAALACVANVIVTFNLEDFPQARLAPFQIEAVTPDSFLERLFDSGIVQAAVVEHRASLRRPALSPSEYLDAFRRCGLPNTANALAPDSI